MISESQYWISDLQKNVEFFHSKLDQRVWRGASFGALEKRIMLSCYIVRKLFESNKVIPDHFNAPVALYAYKGNGKVVDSMNSHRIDELYETQTPEVTSKPFSFVINQIIHSFVFVFAFDAPNQISGIVFNSDRSKKNSLFLLKLKDLINVLSPIAQYYIGKTVFQRNENGELVMVHAE
jgi:hypothetical protein